MRKLIVTADDYGMSLAVNRAIDAGIDAGLITATNVMTNMPCYQEAKKLMGQDGVSVGMHWNVTCGKPVLNPKEIPSLVTSNGVFYDCPEFRNRYRKQQINDEELKKELLAQYQLLIRDVGEPDYWNTHQNVHLDFKIYGQFVKLALELKILKMRSHERIYVAGSDSAKKMPLGWRLMEPIKSTILSNWQSNAQRKGIMSPEGIIFCLNREDVFNLDYTFSHIQWGNHTIGEYVIHPATENDSPYFGEIVDRRIWEYRAFTSEETRKILERNNILLTNYKACKGKQKK